MIKKTKKKKTYSLPILLKTWIQQSIDEALTIAVWVLAWGLAEPYVDVVPKYVRVLMIILLIVVLQHDLLKMVKPKKKQRRKK